MSSRRKKIGIFDMVLYIIMILVVIVTLYPFLNVLAVSLNDALDTVKGGIHIIPRKFTLANYKEIFQSNNNLVNAFIMSVLRTVAGTVAGVLCSTMLAYTLSRKDYILNKFVAVIFILTMYIGGGLIPEYLLIRNLGLINKFAVYIIPGLISTFNVIIIRSFIDNLPMALQESAKIDGANDFVIFYKIIFPLCLPVIATVSLFIAVGQWNSWYDTYLYARSNQGLSTLQYELMKILDNAAASAKPPDPNNPLPQVNTNPESIKMAITMITTVPILLVYPFVQKYFVSGMTLGAVKS
ncbi:carbohydrate ABC transporter permease [Clostridium thermarum]|uniref:carbohydrate ABC transporter permease n=1 Tax=Clostridium thermarum TaxID=1716543 RepID=UPI0011241C2B|nr:carbohydrate ABC transporter permease [Clostridium thermarum]